MTKLKKILALNFDEIPKTNSPKEIQQSFDKISESLTRLFQNILNPTKFHLTLDKAIKRAIALEILKIPNEPQLVIPNESKLRQLAQIILGPSLSRNNISLADLKLSTVLLAIKLKFQNAHISTTAMAALWGSTGTTVVNTAAPTSDEVVVRLQENIAQKIASPFGRDTGERAIDKTNWQSVQNSLNTIVFLFTKISEGEKKEILKKLALFNNGISAGLCSIGNIDAINSIRGQIASYIKDGSADHLCALQDVHIYGQQRLTQCAIQMGFRITEHEGLNIHVVHAIAKSIATTRDGDRVGSQFGDSYRILEEHSQKVRRNSSASVGIFDDPLMLALMVDEKTNSETASLGRLQFLIDHQVITTSTSSSNWSHETKIEIAEWAISTFSGNKTELAKYKLLFPDRPHLLLETAARLGNSVAFTTLQEGLKLVEIVDQDGRHLLHHALWGGNSEILEAVWDQIIQKGETFAKEIFSNTNHHLLHHAAVSNGDSVEFVLTRSDAFLKSPVTKSEWIQQRDEAGFTPLLRAAFHGNTEGFLEILESYPDSIPGTQNPGEPYNGTGLFEKTSAGQTCLHLAVESRNPKLVQIVLDRLEGNHQFVQTKIPGSDLDAYDMALLNNDVPIIEIFLKYILEGKSLEVKLRSTKRFISLGIDLNKVIPELATCTSLPLKLSELTSTEINCVLKTCDNLQEIDISFCENLTEDTFLGVNLSQLKKLNASHSDISGTGLSYLLERANILEELKCVGCRNLEEVNFEDALFLTLKKIDFSFSNISSTGLNSLIRMSPNLEALYISGYADLAKTDLNGIDLSKLRVLDVRKTNLSGEVLSRLIRMNPNLEELYISGCADLSEIDLSGIDLSKLKVLDVHNTNISGEVLSRLIRMSPNLEVLNISRCDLAANCDWHGIALPHLRSLDVSKIKISGKGLSELIKTCEKLETLDMEWCFMSGGDFTGVDLPKLRKINAIHSGLTGEDLQVLLTRSPNLKEIEFSPYNGEVFAVAYQARDSTHPQLAVRINYT